jgi:GntR family transcriptional regulator/MocR family aminotransferase
MPIEWAGLGPEMLLALDRTRPEPLRAQLEGELRDAIRSGRLQAGERLPSSRALARELGVSRGLVLECYAQLQAEGYLSSRGGSATRVAPAAAAAPSRAVDHPGADAPSAAGGHGAGAGAPSGAARGHRAGAGADVGAATASGAAPGPRLAVDFRHGIPDLASFPRSDWAWAMRDACRTATAAELGYSDSRGSAQLREVLAAYLRRVRGAVADPERIVICAGVLQGVNVVLRALALRGVDRVGFEDPGHPDHRAGTALAGVTPVPVRVDASGADPAALAGSGAGAVLLTPAHQSPTGVVLAPGRRQELLAWAAEHGTFVIEDDYDAEFRYDREPVGAMQGLAPERVVGIGSVSKTLSPALRIGWVVCPPDLADGIAHQKEIDDRLSPVLDQIALARLIESGRYDRHLRRMRALYARRRAVLVDALARHAPHVEPQGLAAGFHVVVTLPPGADEATVIAAARERGIGVYGIAPQRFGPPPPEPAPALVLGFGNVGEGAIERGIAATADLLR